MKSLIFVKYFRLCTKFFVFAGFQIWLEVSRHWSLHVPNEPWTFHTGAAFQGGTRQAPHFLTWLWKKFQEQVGWGPRLLEGNSLDTAQWDPPPIGTTKQHHWMTPLLWHRLILCEIWKLHYNKSSLSQAGLGRYIHGGLWLLLLWRSKGELQLLCLFFFPLVFVCLLGFLAFIPILQENQGGWQLWLIF